MSCVLHELSSRHDLASRYEGRARRVKDHLNNQRLVLPQDERIVLNSAIETTMHYPRLPKLWHPEESIRSSTSIRQHLMARRLETEALSIAAFSV